MHVLLLLYIKKILSRALSCTVLCIAYFKRYLFVWVVLFTPTLSSKTSIVDHTTGISGCLLTNSNNNSTSKSLFCFYFVFVRIEPNCTHRWCCVLREENIQKKCQQTHRRFILYMYVGLSRTETLGYSSNRSAGKVGTSNTSLVNKTK